MAHPSLLFAASNDTTLQCHPIASFVVIRSESTKYYYRRFLFLLSSLELLTRNHVWSLSATSAHIAGARALGGTDLIVSEACLGTMTYGIQNTQHDAFEQIDYARSKGINFLDTSELYPVPLTAPKWQPGVTETIIGNYLEFIGPSERDKLVIASKICGYQRKSRVAAARYETPPSKPLDARLDAASVKMACEASLRRLKTDRIDLYQVHWPDRYIPLWGQTVFDHSKKRDDTVPIEETASALRDLIEDGTIRYIGLSNETPLGLCQWIQACQKLGIQDKLATIQNSYSLLDRRFEGDLAEMCDEYQIGLLPWSVLAGGLLSGKYRPGQSTEPDPSSRFVKYPEYMRRWSPATASATTLAAVEDYTQIAYEAGMSPAELAIAFVRARHFTSKLGATLVGATTLEQLKANLSPFDNEASIDNDLLAKINQVHLKYPSSVVDYQLLWQQLLPTSLLLQFGGQYRPGEQRGRSSLIGKVFVRAALERSR